MITPTGIESKVFEPTLATLAVATLKGCCVFLDGEIIEAMDASLLGNV